MAEPSPDDIRDPSLAPFVGVPSTGQTLGAVMPRAGGPPQAPQQAPPDLTKMSPAEMQQQVMRRQMELLGKLGPAMEQDRLLKQQRAQAAAGQGYALDALNRKAATDPLPPKYEPAYQDPNTAPPRFAPGDPAQAIVQPLALLAAIGGLFASRAGTASIRAMTGAMEGLREGNLERYNAYLKEFDEQLKAAQQHNENEHRKYSDAWNNREKTLNERMSIVQMLSTQYGNKAMMAAVGSGNAEAIQAELQMLEGVSKTLTTMTKAAQPGHEFDHIKAEAARLSASGDPDERARGEALTKSIRGQSPALTADERKGIEETKGGIRKEIKASELAGKIEMQEKAIAAAERRNESTIAAKKELAANKAEYDAIARREKHENKLSEDEANWDKRLIAQDERIAAAERRGEKADALKIERDEMRINAQKDLETIRHTNRREDLEYVWDQRLKQTREKIVAAEVRGEEADSLKRELAQQQIDSRKELKEMDEAHQLKLDGIRGERQERRDDKQFDFKKEALGIAHQNKLDEITKRLQMQGQLGGMARRVDGEVYAIWHDLKTQAETSGRQFNPDQAMIEAYRRHRENEGKTGYSSLTPAMQNQIQQGWGSEATEALRGRNFKMLAPERRRLENSVDTATHTETVANFVARRPRAMGVLAQMYNTLRIEQLIQGKMVRAKDQDVDGTQAVRNLGQAFSDAERELVRGQRLPGGSVWQPSDANDAVTLFKLLTQLALSDAATLSTNGQGGTVYLDRRFTDVYSQTTSPQAMMLLMANRQHDVNELWENKLGLDWHKRNDIAKFPFFEGSYTDKDGVINANPQYMERASFNLYSDRKGAALQAAVAKDKSISDEVRLALTIRDSIPNKAALAEWLRGPEAQKNIRLAKEAARILLQNVL